MEAKDIKAMLDDLQKTIEQTLTAKQKTEITEQLKSVNEALVKLEGKGAEIDELKTKLAAAEKALADNQPVIDAFVKAGQERKTEVKAVSFAEGFAKAIEEKKDDLMKFGKSKGDVLSIDLKNISLKTVGDMTTTGNLSASTAAVQSYGTNGLIPGDMINFRDLIPTAFSPTGQYTFYREGAGEGAVTQQTEGSGKSQVDTDFTAVQVVNKYLAAYVRYSKQMMYNLPWLQSTLSRILLRKFYQKENTLFYQNLATNATPDSLSGSDLAQKIVEIIGDQRANNFSASAVLIPAANWYDLMTTRYPSSGTSYSVPGGMLIDAMGNVRVAGVPVIAAPWVTAGDITVIDRDYIERVETESLRVEFSFEDANNFTENKVTARIECFEELNLIRTDAHLNYGTAS